MNQDDLQKINALFQHLDGLTESINAISGPSLLMREKEYQQTEDRIQEMRMDKIEIWQTILNIVAGPRKELLRAA